MGADEAVEIRSGGTGEGEPVGQVMAAQFINDGQGLVAASGGGFMSGSEKFVGRFAHGGHDDDGAAGFVLFDDGRDSGNGVAGFDGGAAEFHDDHVSRRSLLRP